MSLLTDEPMWASWGIAITSRQAKTDARTDTPIRRAVRYAMAGIAATSATLSTRNRYTSRSKDQVASPGIIVVMKVDAAPIDA